MKYTAQSAHSNASVLEGTGYNQCMHALINACMYGNHRRALHYSMHTTKAGQDGTSTAPVSRCAWQ
jgi:hypothetical protein